MVGEGGISFRQIRQNMKKLQKDGSDQQVDMMIRKLSGQPILKNRIKKIHQYLNKQQSYYCSHESIVEVF